jgi:hypothetical protein
LRVHAAHDEPKWIAFIEILHYFFECETSLFTTISEQSQLFIEFIEVKLEEVTQMIFSLFRRGACAEEVSKFDSRSPKPCVLEIYDDHICWISLILTRISELKIKYVCIFS